MGSQGGSPRRRSPARGRGRCFSVLSAQGPGGLLGRVPGPRGSRGAHAAAAPRTGSASRRSPRRPHSPLWRRCRRPSLGTEALLRLPPVLAFAAVQLSQEVKPRLRSARRVALCCPRTDAGSRRGGQGSEARLSSSFTFWRPPPVPWTRSLGRFYFTLATGLEELRFPSPAPTTSSEENKVDLSESNKAQ